MGIVRKLTEYSFNSSMKVAFSFNVFEILLFQERSVFSFVHRMTGKEKAKFPVRNQKNSSVFVEIHDARWISGEILYLF